MDSVNSEKQQIMGQPEQFSTNNSDYNSRPPASQRKKVEHIIMEAQDGMKVLMEEKDREIDYLTQRLIQIDYNWAIKKKDSSCQTEKINKN